MVEKIKNNGRKINLEMILTGVLVVTSIGVTIPTSYAKTPTVSSFESDPWILKPTDTVHKGTKVEDIQIMGFDSSLDKYAVSNVTELSRNKVYDDNIKRKLEEDAIKKEQEIKLAREKNEAMAKAQKANTLTASKSNIKVAQGTHNHPTGVNNYTGLIEKYSQKNGLDPEIVKALISQESGGNPNSKGSAWGLMQIESTVVSEFISYGKREFGQTWTSNDRSDPEKNIAFGTYRLKQNLNHYSGDYTKALQAYNFSHYSLDKLIAKFGNNWMQHRDQMAYYNGHHNRTGKTSYGDPKYVENVMKFYKK